MINNTVLNQGVEQSYYARNSSQRWIKKRLRATGGLAKPLGRYTQLNKLIFELKSFEY